MLGWSRAGSPAGGTQRSGAAQMVAEDAARIRVVTPRPQPVNDTMKHIAWWLTIDALMIVLSSTIMFAVIWLAR
jgi:hypothetical protein